MLGGVIFQPTVGWLLDHYAETHLSVNALHFSSSNFYTPEAFQYALSILPLSSFISVGICFLLKKRNH
jgi:hypothetical protein